MLDQPVADRLLGIGGPRAKPRQPVDHGAHQVEAVKLVQHAHVERRRGRALLLVAAHMDIAVPMPTVGQAMDEPRIAVKGEDDRLVRGEQRIEIPVREPVRVLGRRLQRHQIDDVDHAHLDLGQMPAHELDRGQRLQGRHVAAAGHHHVGLAAAVVAGPLPDAEAGLAVLGRLVHREPLRRGLLAGDDDVDVVAAAQAMVGDREQAVGVGRQVDADDLGLLVHDVVDEAGILVAEAIVVLPPDMARQQVVQRGDRPSPLDLVAHFQPLGVLVDHRIDDVDEGLVAREEAVPSGQEITLQPALALMLAQDLHDASVGCEMIVIGKGLRLPGAVGDLEDVLPAVGVVLVGAEEPEVALWHVELHDIAQVAAHDPRRLGRDGAGGANLHRIVAKIGKPQVVQQQAAIGVRIGAHAAIALRRQRCQVALQPTVVVEQLGWPVALHPLFEDAHVLRLFVHLPHRHLVRTPVALGALSVDFLGAGPALGRTEHDHRPTRAFARRLLCARLDAADFTGDRLQCGGHELVHFFRVVALDEMGRVAIAAKELLQFLMADASQDGGVGDLVAVEVQDRQNRAVGRCV